MHKMYPLFLASYNKKMHVHNENANRRDFCGIIAGRVKKAVDDIVISADSIEVMHCILTWF